MTLINRIEKMEKELAELKALIGVETSKPEALVHGIRIDCWTELQEGDKLYISAGFARGGDEDGSNYPAGVYTVSDVEPEDYDGPLPILLNEAGWIDFDCISKRMNIFKV